MKTRKFVFFLAFVGLTAGLFADIPDKGYGKPTDCRVEPLVQSMWGQTTATGLSDGKRCYNYYVTNQTDAAHDYVGCFPVAVGQIMRYWRCNCTNGSVSVDCVVSNGTGVVTNALTTFGGPYAWDNMPLETHQTEPTDEQRQTIGRLMHDLAVASGSSFSWEHTVASPLSVRKCLLERVGGFASAETVVFNDGNCPYSIDLLKRIVLPNLDAGAPVVLSFAYEGIEITHAVVVDGYGYDKDGRLMLHVNVGAWGNGDGWFYADEGVRAGGYDYKEVSVCFFNMFPTNCGSVVSGRILDVSHRAVEGAAVTAYSNGTAVATCTTKANGTYAFVLPAGTYAIRAEKRSGNDVFSAELLQPLTVGPTESRQVTEESGEWNYRNEPEYAPLIGNVIADDLMLPGLYSEQAEPPTVSPNGGKIAGVTEVTLTCATTNAVIRYTLDGSDPTTQSTRYAAPFTISDGVTVKAVAFARNMNPSAMTTATFTYANTSKPVGDDQDAPMMLVGTNLTRKVDGYCKYTRTDNDPIVDWEYWEDCYSNNSYVVESHSSWFRWTAPGRGTVQVKGEITGPSESGYFYDKDDNLLFENRSPQYGTSMVIYEVNDVGSVIKECVRAQSGSEPCFVTDEEGNVHRYVAETFLGVADMNFPVEQGKTYLIQCVCPYHLEENYINQFYFGGPYIFLWDMTQYVGPFEDMGDGWFVIPFKSNMAFLNLSLTANLTVKPPAAARMTVPDMPHASVRVQANKAEVSNPSNGVQLQPGVNYTITYTAKDGYAFSDEKTTWTAVVRDDTGADFSVADLDDYPSGGPTAIGWRRPKTDSEVVIRSALAADGFTGAILSEVTSLATFDAFVKYLGEKGVKAPAALTDAQKANAYLCYRLGAEKIPTDALTSEDVTITATEAQTDGSLALELQITGVEPGETVPPQVIEAVVSAAGGDDLANLSKENVSLTGVGTADGKVKVTVSPKAASPDSRPAKFFTRLEILK